ncbi:hypothetical protein DPEC_G00162010 [Dallia pectoralis]|uniref:Uncharacterized protein n=1 Tax=Dallia pectoralis TaxID=75939 RepID=A0ACC2GGL7_DALPE|nr:hypothetical protein DPEC_G00162010 [Dallia pectoralis]
MEIEREIKKMTLGHEIGAGASCLKCKDKCEGFELHFWRKICRNCKCGLTEHDVQMQSDDDRKVGRLFEDTKYTGLIAKLKTDSVPTYQSSQVTFSISASPMAATGVPYSFPYDNTVAATAGSGYEPGPGAGAGFGPGAGGMPGAGTGAGTGFGPGAGGKPGAAAGFGAGAGATPGTGPTTGPDAGAGTRFGAGSGGGASAGPTIVPKPVAASAMPANVVKDTTPMKSVTYEWAPPGVKQYMAMRYIELLPPERRPIFGTPGAVYRRQQMAMQLPEHDQDPAKCHELTPAEVKQMQQFVRRYKDEALGVGDVKLPEEMGQGGPGQGGQGGPGQGGQGGPGQGGQGGPGQGGPGGPGQGGPGQGGPGQGGQGGPGQGGPGQGGPGQGGPGQGGQGGPGQGGPGQGGPGGPGQGVPGQGGQGGPGHGHHGGPGQGIHGMGDPRVATGAGSNQGGGPQAGPGSGAGMAGSGDMGTAATAGVHQAGPCGHYTCQHCNLPMRQGEPAVFAERAGYDKLWHPACFVCCTCSELLVDMIYFWKKGRLYCGRHYGDSEKPRCGGCDELIFSNEYTQAEDQNWHLKHFCCFDCDCVLAGETYVMENNKPVCKPCYMKSHAVVCVACQKPVEPEAQRVSYGEFHWHAEPQCFRCSGCAKCLVGVRFMAVQRQLFCSVECKKKTVT